MGAYTLFSLGRVFDRWNILGDPADDSLWFASRRHVHERQSSYGDGVAGASGDSTALF